MCASEATAGAETAERDWTGARRSNHLSQLAVALGDIERHRQDLRAKRKVLQEKQAELAPLLERLKTWGSALVDCLSLEISNVANDLELVTTSSNIHADQQNQLELKQRRLAVERSEAERTLTDTKSFVERRRYQRDQLGDEGRLEPNERAEDGHSRWIGEREQEQANLVERRAHMQQMDQRLRDLNSERARVESESARADADVRNVQSRLDAAAKQTRAIASNDVVLAHFGENFDPLRHGAKEDLLRKQADAFQSVLTFQLDHALISRNQQGIEKYQVLPPVRDVELVLDRLRDAGIEASTGLRYLSETHNCEEAENLIRHDPGKYAGVFVGAKDWPRVPTLAWPEVTQPIEVSLFPHGTECQNGFKSHVVVPSRPAFDKPEASRRSLRLEDELTSTKRQLEAKRAEYHALGEVLTLLTTFLEQYGDGRLVVIERELRERVRHAEGLRSRSEELANDIAEVERQRTSTRAAELSSPERLNSQIQPGPSIVFRHS